MKDNLYLDEDGFLSEKFSENEIEKRYEKYFLLSKNVNRYTYQFLNKIDIKLKDKDRTIKLFFAITFLKMHKDFQAVIILLKRGLKVQAMCVLRTLLERFYIMCAVSKDKESYNDWVRSFIERNRRRACDIKNRKPGLENIIIPSIWEKELNNRQKIVRVEEWAKKADLMGIHNTMYAALSDNIHYTSGGMEQDIIKNNDEPEAVEARPTVEGLDNELYHTILLLLESIKILAKELNIDCIGLKGFEEELDVLGASLGQD